MRNTKINTEMPSRRSATADSLRNFRNTYFHHKTAERGGAQVSGFGEYMDEVSEAREIELELAALES